MQSFKMKNEGTDPTGRMRNINPFYPFAIPREFFVSVFVKGCVWGTCHATDGRVEFFYYGPSRFL